jgi:hypothetical protein
MRKPGESVLQEGFYEHVLVVEEQHGADESEDGSEAKDGLPRGYTARTMERTERNDVVVFVLAAWGALRDGCSSCPPPRPTSVPQRARNWPSHVIGCHVQLFDGIVDFLNPHEDFR